MPVVAYNVRLKLIMKAVSEYCCFTCEQLFFILALIHLHNILHIIKDFNVNGWVRHNGRSSPFQSNFGAAKDT